MTNLLDMRSLHIEQAKTTFVALVNEAITSNEPIHILEGNQKVAVLLSSDEYETLLETLEVLSDSKLMAELRESRDTCQKYFTSDEVIDRLVSDGKLANDYRTRHGYFLPLNNQEEN